MAPVQAYTIFKKQNGILSMSPDRQLVFWTGSGTALPALTITAGTITNLKQTPETSDKVMLRIEVKEKADAETVTHTFNFNAPSNPRVELNNIKDAIAAAISASKLVANGDSSGRGASSASMAIASALSAGKDWNDDEKLKADTKLQKELFTANPELQKVFMEAMKMRPESISMTQFTSQFWASRIHLLRAFALQKQPQAAYNVLASLKRNEGGKSLTLSDQHVRLIFKQYPLMQRVYDEVVPKKCNEVDFWARFFQSRLLRVLRGEKYSDKDSKDSILDAEAYLNAPELTGLRGREYRAPRFIDMEGNEVNHSQKKGNRPDREQRPESTRNVPIIRALNNMSERLMADVRLSDVDPSAPIGMDETTYNNLRLRDLQGTQEQQKIILKIRDQTNFTSEGRDTAINGDVANARSIDPTRALTFVCADLSSAFPQPGVGVIKTSYREDGEDEMDEDGDEDDASTLASRKASLHIMELIRQNRQQTEGDTTAFAGLSENIVERLKLTHATTNEFLHQFWNAFLSGNPERAAEVVSLAESLQRAERRIKAVAKDAEDERNVQIEGLKKRAKKIFEETGHKQKVNYKKVQGGAELVEHLLKPTSEALILAQKKFQKAFQEQSAMACI